jgi:hypothetical protein
MEIAYTCSLGPHCHSSYLLKQNNLKKASYPFDWIFTKYNTIQEIINDNFDEFLNKENYIEISPEKCGHKLYHDSMFWHHNPLTNNEHYNYFKRCVERFKDMLLSRKQKLFIYLVKDVKEIDENVFQNNIISLNETLKTKTKNFRLLAIVVYPNEEKNSYTFNSVDNVDFLKINVLSTSNGVQFINEKDNAYINIILKVKYKYKLKEYYKT